MSRTGGLRMTKGTKSYFANYLGGQVEYPDSRICGINLRDERLELYFENKTYGDRFEKKPKFVIP